MLSGGKIGGQESDAILRATEALFQTFRVTVVLGLLSVVVRVGQLLSCVDVARGKERDTRYIDCVSHYYAYEVRVARVIDEPPNVSLQLSIY